jgi:hypothetical protein
MFPVSTDRWLNVDGVERARAKSIGDFTGWDQGYRLMLANVLTGDRPWLSTLHLVALYGRALSPAEVIQNFRSGSAGTGDQAALAQLQALYSFDEGAGTEIHDSSWASSPLDLHVDKVEAIEWTTDGLVVRDTTHVLSTLPATKIVSAAQATNELTLEAWVRQMSGSQNHTQAIATLATEDGKSSTVALRQQTSDHDQSIRYEVRMRTSSTSSKGASLKTPEITFQTDLAHIVYTRDALGTTRLYVNRLKQTERTVAGDFTEWDAMARLVLANDPAGKQPWLGEYQQLAIYNRALCPFEISRQFEAGAKDTTLIHLIADYGNTTTLGVRLN